MQVDPLFSLAQRVGAYLLPKKLYLATAESCTGGELSALLTRVPGSSAWFDCGFVTYSNESKQNLLGVPAAILSAHGAVSDITAQAMAEGALKRSHAHLSIAITGIAGPSGGTREKPVGTVWIAWSQRDHETQIMRYHFTGNRDAIRRQAVVAALQRLTL